MALESERPDLIARVQALADKARNRDSDDRVRYRAENPELFAWKQELFRVFDGCKDTFFKDYQTGREWRSK